MNSSVACTCTEEKTSGMDTDEQVGFRKRKVFTIRLWTTSWKVVKEGVCYSWHSWM